MIALLAKAIIGLLVGILVGLTLLGAGVVLLPILMFGLGVSPIIAVGSDALFNCFTKIGSGYLHWRKGSVNWSIAGALLAGSIPGSLLGVGLLVLVRNAYGDSVNYLLRIATGLLLVI